MYKYYKGESKTLCSECFDGWVMDTSLYKEVEEDLSYSFALPPRCFECKEEITERES